VAAAGVHDEAGAFLGFNEAFAGVRAVELQGEVVHVGHQLHESGGVGLLDCRRGVRGFFAEPSARSSVLRLCG
jgi:hypothetical protein